MGARRNIELSPRLRAGVGRSGNANQNLKTTGYILLSLSFLLLLNAVRIVWFSNKLIETSRATTEVEVFGQNTKTDSFENEKLEFKTYITKKGDTLFSLSQKFDISWTTLAGLNNLEAPFTLKTGQKLIVPKKPTE